MDRNAEVAELEKRFQAASLAAREFAHAIRREWGSATLKHDVVILPLVFSNDEFNGLLERERAFALAAIREGIEL